MTTQRLTIQEAATRLGISEVTVRRRLKAGQLHGEQEATPQGYRWFVILEEPEEEGSDEPSRAEESPDRATTQQVITRSQSPIQDNNTPTQTDDHRLVTELQDRLDFLEAQVPRQSELTEQLRDRIAYLEGDIEDRKRAQDQEREIQREEIQRRDTLMAQQTSIIQSQTQTITSLSEQLKSLPEGKPAETSRTVHVYLSQLLPTLITTGIVSLGGIGVAVRVAWSVFDIPSAQDLTEKTSLTVATGFMVTALIVSSATYPIAKGWHQAREQDRPDEVRKEAIKVVVIGLITLTLTFMALYYAWPR